MPFPTFPPLVDLLLLLVFPVFLPFLLFFLPDFPLSLVREVVGAGVSTKIGWMVSSAEINRTETSSASMEPPRLARSSLMSSMPSKIVFVREASEGRVSRGISGSIMYCTRYNTSPVLGTSWSCRSLEGGSSLQPETSVINTRMRPISMDRLSARLASHEALRTSTIASMSTSQSSTWTRTRASEKCDGDVGLLLGESLGESLSESLGGLLGIPEGLLLGESLGGLLGIPEGFPLGVSLGEMEGIKLLLGDPLGDLLGQSLGLPEGCLLGELLGESEGIELLLGELLGETLG